MLPPRPLRIKSSQQGNHRDHQKGRKNQSAQFDVNFSYTYNVLPEYPCKPEGKPNAISRLLQRFNARKAYKDQDKICISIPPLMKRLTPRAVHTMPTGETGLFGNKNGDELQDSLNPFYNNSTNFYKYYFQATKSTECQYPKHLLDRNE